MSTLKSQVVFLDGVLVGDEHIEKQGDPPTFATGVDLKQTLLVYNFEDGELVSVTRYVTLETPAHKPLLWAEREPYEFSEVERLALAGKTITPDQPL